MVVSGLGQLNRPNIPDIAGLDDFEGTVFHSARWDHDHDLRGERVAVIGIGASAIQFVPRVAAQARHTTLFQRSVNYVAPKPDRRYRPWERWLLDHVPPLQRAYRASIYWRFEARFPLMRKGNRLGKLMQDRFGKELGKLVSSTLPREALIPDYTPGCRRILIANDWYPTLLRPDVEVVTDEVAEITQHAVRTAGGDEFGVDTIIFGTGFRSTEFLSPLRITGRDGLDLNEVWADGAYAYLGVAVAGFPNLFMLYGPNTNLGHNSILFMIEQQVGVDPFAAGRHGPRRIELRGGDRRCHGALRRPDPSSCANAPCGPRTATAGTRPTRGASPTTGLTTPSATGVGCGTGYRVTSG